MENSPRLSKRRRREARQSAKAAMRERQDALTVDAQVGGALGGDAGTCYCGTDQLVELLGDDDDWARRAANSRRPSQGVGRGRGGRSEEALRRVHELLFVCEGCSGLVNGQAARVRAYAAGRLSFVGTDGCGSRACSGNHRPGFVSSWTGAHGERAVGGGASAGKMAIDDRTYARMGGG